MPTAVERLLDLFLKLDGIEGRHEQSVLNNAFLKIDSDLLKLSNANAVYVPEARTRTVIEVRIRRDR